MNGISLAEEESGVLDQGLEHARTAPAAPTGARWGQCTLGWSRTQGRRRLRGRYPQIRHPHQVVGCGHQVPCETSSVQPSVARAPEPTHRPFGYAQDMLHPPEDLLYPLAHPLAQGIPRMPGSPPVDGAGASPGVLCHVRVIRRLPMAGNPFPRVIVPIPCDGLRMEPPLTGLVQKQRHHVPLHRARGLGHGGIDRRPTSTYMRSNSGDNSAEACSARPLMVHREWFPGTRVSRSMKASIVTWGSRRPRTSPPLWAIATSYS